MPVVHVHSENGDAIHMPALQSYSLTGRSSSLAGATGDPDTGVAMPPSVLRYGGTGVIAYEEQARHAGLSGALGFSPAVYAAYRPGESGLDVSEASTSGTHQVCHDQQAAPQEAAEAHEAIIGSPNVAYIAEEVAYPSENEYPYHYEHASDLPPHYTTSPNALCDQDLNDSVYPSQFVSESNEAEFDTVHPDRHLSDTSSVEPAAEYAAYDGVQTHIYQEFRPYHALEQDHAQDAHLSSSSHPQSNAAYGTEFYSDPHATATRAVDYETRSGSQRVPAVTSRPESPVPISGYPHSAGIQSLGSHPVFDGYQYHHDQTAGPADDTVGGQTFVSGSVTPDDSASVEGYGYDRSSDGYFDRSQQRGGSFPLAPHGHRESPVAPTTALARDPAVASIDTSSSYVNTVQAVRRGDQISARSRSHSYVRYGDTNPEYIDYSHQSHAGIPAIPSGGRYGSPSSPPISHIPASFVGVPIDGGYAHHEQSQQPVYRLIFPEQTPASSPPTQVHDLYGSQPNHTDHSHPAFVRTTMLEPAVTMSTVEQSYSSHTAANHGHQAVETGYTTHETYDRAVNPPITRYHHAGPTALHNRFSQAVDYDPHPAHHVLSGHTSHPTSLHHPQSMSHGHDSSLQGHSRELLTRNIWTTGDAGTVVG
jgi:hypothetical protein